LPIPEIRIVSYADFAYKTSPATARVISLSLFGGLAFGFAMGFVREKLDRAVRTRKDVEGLLKRECVAMVPMIGADERPRAPRRLGRRRIFASRIELPFSVDLGEERAFSFCATGARPLIDAPFSQYAETIRGLKLSTDAHSAKAESKVIGFTSSLPGEGKSTIASALAGLSGLVGARTILIDCDLRNSALSQSLTPDATSGLLEVISGSLSLESVIWRDIETGIDFLPMVHTTALSNTTQILAGESMRHLFDELRQHYEYIVVDLSPVLPVVDVRATTEFIDFYFFVIEWGATPVETVRDALESAFEVYQNTAGFVINKVNLKRINRYSDYHVGYDRPPYLEKSLKEKWGRIYSA
jgi:succinoglycan biosynthesis transport protein ExoP